MHISSLPGKFGIGTMGKEAFEFVEFLRDAGMKSWEVLPLSPTGYGDSPYQGLSAFAGNPYFIDIELLAEEGLLDEKWLREDWENEPDRVDYGVVYDKRNKMFNDLYENFRQAENRKFDDFCKNNSYWLSDYALFSAIKEKYGGAGLFSWREDLRKRKPESLEREKERLFSGIEKHKMIQFLFFKQWKKLKDYANGNGIEIIGDMPLYVSADSADLWAHPEIFELDADGFPTRVAGCPPDAFSPDGQLWGNPLYDWSYLKKTEYAWWKRRFLHNLELFDRIRLDHFRGFEAFYAIPASSGAAFGKWESGPGGDFFDAINGLEGRIIAENLGFLTSGVHELLEKTGFPGMRVLEFAFDGSDSEHLPHNYIRNCVAYVGTHDNDTILGWLNEMDSRSRVGLNNYLKGESVWDVMDGVLMSVADTVILAMQDLLGLGGDARMNIPGKSGGNWRWRSTPGDINPILAKKIKGHLETYKRI